MFSIREAVVFGWHKLKERSGLVFGVVLTMFALEVVSSMVQKTLQGTLLGAMASIVLAIAGIVLGAGATLIFLRLVKGEPARYRDIVPEIRLVWKYFAVSVLTGVIVLAPLVVAGSLSFVLLASTGSINFSEGIPAEGSLPMLVIAGLITAVAGIAAVYLGLRYSMARLSVVDGAEILESLRQSTRLTTGVMWRLLLFVLAIIGLNLLGLLAFAVGLLVTVPISMLAFIHVYLARKEAAS